MEVEAGRYVWIPCEVKPGAFSDERLVLVNSELGDWVGFVPVQFLKEPLEKGRTLVQALVVDVREDRFTAKLPGEPLSQTLLLNTLAEVDSVDSVQARHS